MAGIRLSARLEDVTASCGHPATAYIPPGNIGPVGRRNIAEAQGRPCRACRQNEPNVIATLGDRFTIVCDSVTHQRLKDGHLDQELGPCICTPFTTADRLYREAMHAFGSTPSATNFARLLDCMRQYQDTFWEQREASERVEDTNPTIILAVSGDTRGVMLGVAAAGILGEGSYKRLLDLDAGQLRQVARFAEMVAGLKVRESAILPSACPLRETPQLKCPKLDDPHPLTLISLACVDCGGMVVVSGEHLQIGSPDCQFHSSQRNPEAPL